MISSKVTSLKTYSAGYFSKQQNETGYFCGMTLLTCAVMLRMMNFRRIRIPNNIHIFKLDEYEYEYYLEFKKTFEYYLWEIFGPNYSNNPNIRGNTATYSSALETL